MTFIFFDSIFFNEKEYDFEEWEGEIIHEWFTTIHTEYNVYVDPLTDQFCIDRYQETREYDIYRYVDPIVEEINDSISLEEIKDENIHHYKKVFQSISNYKQRQNHIKNTLYYELMEKSMHPNRLEWIF